MTESELYRFEEGKNISKKIEHLKWALSIIDGDGHFRDCELGMTIAEPRGMNSLSFGVHELSIKYRSLHNDCLRDMIKSLIAKYEKEFKKL